MIDDKETVAEPQSPYHTWPDEVPANGDAAVVQEATPFPNPPQPDQPPVFDAPFEAQFVPVAYTPQTTEETVRTSGLAWSAGAVFFGSVAFMLLLGWLADLLLGSSPWGIVGGLVLGAVIGFLQFFRITSKIFKKGDMPQTRPLLGRNDEDTHH